MAELKIGTEYTIKAQVTEPMTARQMGSGQAEVLATPSLLALMEQAAWKSVAPMLEEGQSTVGTFAALKHLAATPPGMQAERLCRGYLGCLRTVFKPRRRGVCGALPAGRGGGQRPHPCRRGQGCLGAPQAGLCGKFPGYAG